MSRPPSRRPGRRVAGVLVALGAVLAMAACSAGSSTPTTTGAPATGSGPASASAAPEAAGTLTVFAAASLKSTFTEIGRTFQEQHPGASVTFNFAGSSDLVTQLTSGAPADVVATADRSTMARAVDGGVIDGAPIDFAGNTLTIVTAPGNPKGITGFADLATAGRQVVVCAPQVPCGAATRTLEQSTGVTLTPVSEESSVTDVLNKVTTGQADAGLVYVTDATVAGDKVAVVAFPEAASVVNPYPIARVAGAAQPDLAAAFVELVTGPDGQRILSDAGFRPAG